MSRVDILMLIKTTGLEYDDRLRKECLSLKELKFSHEICVLEYENAKKQGETEYGTPYNAINILSRKIFPRAKGLIIKTLEMYTKFTFSILIKRPKKVWLHNIEMAGMLPILFIFRKIGVINTIIWDQHELPPEIVFRNKILRWVFTYAINWCDKVIVANKERREYLLKHLLLDRRHRIHVLDNYVDRNFFSIPVKPLPPNIVERLEGQRYILAQGGAGPGRYVDKLIEGIMSIDNIKLIVVGPYLKTLYTKLQNEWGDMLGKKVIFTGLVPQMELAKYIDHSIASVILYSAKEDNSYLCSPNRLYQAISRGVPVVVGNNPPMRAKVDTIKNGVILKGDGRSVKDIERGINSLIKDYSIYKRNADRFKGSFLWESQKGEMVEVLGGKKDV